MFIIFLRFSDNKDKAKEFMSGHKAWIKQGIDDEVFHLVGSLKPNLGGCILASNVDRESIELRVNQDPFVIEDIVTAEINEITPSMANDKLKFLVG
ncbi:hypothetical protein [Vibrio sp. RE88]|uniref:YciI family protein n=1 Tax=Vibrio sp. RE88 TaxID=2607610 RepID=UPI00149366D5|nr:hypothetical protein [Vibrio sp. RE88]NOH63144.1 hypothetical protein [Vibrio sp. RE88]